MSSPRFPGRDLRLERIDRTGLQPAPLGEAAQAAELSPAAARDYLAAYQALIDAVFLAPGAAEWLFGLRVAVAALIAKDAGVPRVPVASDAICTDPHANRP